MTAAEAGLAIVVSVLSIAASIGVGVRALVRRIQSAARRDKEFEDMKVTVEETDRAVGLVQTRLAQLEVPRRGILNELDSVQHGLHGVQRELDGVQRELERLRSELAEVRANAGAA